MARKKIDWNDIGDYDREDLNCLYVCAIRYSIGRATYMPRLVTDYIKRHDDTLTLKGVSNMIRDIEEQRDRYVTENERKSGIGPFGMDCDARTWLEFLDWLKNWKETHNGKE